jgi:hypothetical protein
VAQAAAWKNTAKCQGNGKPMTIVSEIQYAFQGRAMPRQVVLGDSPRTSEYLEALNFQGTSWEMMDSDFLVKNSDALYAFTPEAFCYYLSAFLSHGFKHQQAPPIYMDAILGMLDRSPNPDLWDDSFRRRWSILRTNECRVVEKWLLALSECPEGIFDLLTLDRAFDTLQLLMKCKKEGRSYTS